MDGEGAKRFAPDRIQVVRVRLDRALSKLGVASRAEAKRLIADGHVRVGSRVVTDPAALVVPETADILVGGTPARAAAWRMVALHKPRGTVTTRRDPEGRATVFDLLGKAAVGLVAVGRLDLASSGLLLLTSDTRLADWLTDPRTGIVRRYVVSVRGALPVDAARRLERGLDGLRAHRAIVRKQSTRESHLIVELTEGRNREVRRMLAALGCEVTRLLRVAYGPIELGALQPGEWRELDRRTVRGAFPSAPMRLVT